MALLLKDIPPRTIAASPRTISAYVAHKVCMEETLQNWGRCVSARLVPHWQNLTTRNYWHLSRRLICHRPVRIWCVPWRAAKLSIC